MSKWISVEERLPPLDTKILCYCEYEWGGELQKKYSFWDLFRRRFVLRNRYVRKRSRYRMDAAAKTAENTQTNKQISKRISKQRSKNMDAVEFLRDFRRMCRSYGDSCDNCKLDGSGCSFSDSGCDYEKMIRVVEEWAKEHPGKTKLSEFKKLFPNYNYPSDLPRACVRVFDCTATCRTNCHECKKKFWFTPIEEEEE